MLSVVLENPPITRIVTWSCGVGFARGCSFGAECFKRRWRQLLELCERSCCAPTNELCHRNSQNGEICIVLTVGTQSATLQFTLPECCRNNGHLSNPCNRVAPKLRACLLLHSPKTCTLSRANMASHFCKSSVDKIGRGATATAPSRTSCSYKAPMLVCSISQSKTLQ